MPNTDGGLARIAADDYQLHAFAEVVGKCSHYASLLCLLILLLTPQKGSALFDIGSRAITGIHAHGFLTPGIPRSDMKGGNPVTFPYFLNLISSRSIETRVRRKCSMLCATFIDAKARMQPPIGLLIPLTPSNPHLLPSPLPP